MGYCPLCTSAHVSSASTVAENNPFLLVYFFNRFKSTPPTTSYTIADIRKECPGNICSLMQKFRAANFATTEGIPRVGV